MSVSPLKRFLLAAVLWLPLAFFLWFWFAAPFSWPVIALAKSILPHAWPTLFISASQGADLLDGQGRILGHPGYLMQISSNVLVNVSPPGQPPKFGFIEPVVNPMIYGYALPLFAGLVLATPLTRWRRTAQIVIQQDARQASTIRWSFVRSTTSAAATSARRNARREPELPL